MVVPRVVVVELLVEEAGGVLRWWRMLLVLGLMGLMRLVVLVLMLVGRTLGEGMLHHLWAPIRRYTIDLTLRSPPLHIMSHPTFIRRRSCSIH